AGATGASLTLTNVQSSQAGNYAVQITNASGSITSSNALLTVNVPVCANAPSNLVSWWQAEGNSNDFAGGNNGILRNGATFAAGKVGSAFSFDGVNDYVEVPNSANISFATNAPMSFELWAYRIG